MAKMKWLIQFDTDRKFNCEGKISARDRTGPASVDQRFNNSIV